MISTISMDVQKSDISAGQKLALTKTLNRSITGGQANLMSAISEVMYVKMLESVFPVESIIHKPNYDFDVMFQGHKVDVKSKQRKHIPIRDDWEASIVGYSKDIQMCEYYAFCQISHVDGNKDKFKTFTFFGHMDKESFFKEARAMKKGETDGSNNFIVRQDCYNMYYRDLDGFPDKILDKLRKADYLVERL